MLPLFPYFFAKFTLSFTAADFGIADGAYDSKQTGELGRSLDGKKLIFTFARGAADTYARVYYGSNWFDLRTGDNLLIHYYRLKDVYLGNGAGPYNNAELKPATLEVYMEYVDLDADGIKDDAYNSTTPIPISVVTHDNGNTWAIIQDSLKELGYRTTAEPLILSPHHFGIPQNRERVIILGKYDPDNRDIPLVVEFGELKKKQDNSIYGVLEENRVDELYYISEYEEMVLQAWNEFYHGINLKVIGFPIWADYFKYEGSLEEFPNWKAEFIRKNIKLYQENREFIDKWLDKYNNLKEFAPTHHKMEWQCGTRIDSVWEGVIQFRPSGVRVKTPDCFQALVAMVQIPIIGRYKRKMTVEEAARLQSFP